MRQAGQRHRDGLRAVGGLGDDLEVGLRVEDAAHAVADDRVVVGHEHAGLQRRGHGAGTTRRTRVPACGERPILRLPWTSSARWRIPVMPRASAPR